MQGNITNYIMEFKFNNIIEFIIEYNIIEYLNFNEM